MRDPPGQFSGLASRSGIMSEHLEISRVRIDLRDHVRVRVRVLRVLSSRESLALISRRCNRIRRRLLIFFFSVSRKMCIYYSRVSLPTYFVGYSWIDISVGKPAISFIKSNWTRVGGFVESNYMLMARFAWQLSFVSQSARAELAFGPLRFRRWPMSVPTRPPL